MGKNDYITYNIEKPGIGGMYWQQCKYARI